LSLEKLLAPLTVEQFLSDQWPAQPYVTHGLQIDELTRLPFLSSLDALLKKWPRKVQVHLPDIADESSAIDADPADARKLFANRLALLFNNAHTQSPVLQKWLETIQSELGLPRSTHARCMIYATPDGKGTAAHFDQNINFVLQIHGTKTWWIAPNETFENPTERFTIGQPLDPELASYAMSEPPTTMPEPAQKVVLAPGSMLFVPRGYWHRTEATGEALALNFTFSQPTYIDLFLAALRSRLTLSHAWRELADGVSSADAGRRELAAVKLDHLLMDLTEDLPNWRAADILGATEGDSELT
jgi:50S ribosomal protein L16 3-hydroxylase